MKNKIFDWNYISDKLSEEQITELKKILPYLSP